MILDWDFEPSQRSLRQRAAELRARFLQGRPFPSSEVLKPISSSGAWSLLFVYSPDGKLLRSHRFTISRLRELDRRLLIICATENVRTVPVELHKLSDALYWKALAGYDFSAYFLGLDAIATTSPGADVFVMNDSVFGPFGDLEILLQRMRWELSGFTASAERMNHIQSYAFRIQDVTLQRLRALKSVLSRSIAYDDFESVIRVQELRFAQVAARTMKVGAMWFDPTGSNPAIHRPVELIESGYPFLKKSLVGKFSHLVEGWNIRSYLASKKHPVDE
ncbi:MAG: hypothetical protein ABIQ86_16525 [Steroidobacteraceae bacterium]